MNTQQGPMTEAMYYVLLALHRPAHGYQLMQQIARASRGRVQMGPGTLYGVLTRMEKEGLIVLSENDGRRKTLFNTAVSLLPPEDLRLVTASLSSRPELEEQPVKERALAAVELVQQAADRRGVSLKLNKKPKKG